MSAAMRILENHLIIALSPDRKRLYTTQVPGDFESDPGAISSFEIVETSGELRKLNEPASHSMRRPRI